MPAPSPSSSAPHPSPSRDATGRRPVVPRRAGQLLAELRTTADALEGLVEPPLPSRPAAMAVEDADPLLDRLDGAREQATALAASARGAADDAETFSATVDELRAAATAYGEADQLPDSDAPDDVAAAWRDELERLQTYEAVIDDAGAETTSPHLEPVADAQRTFVAGMQRIAERAVDHLDEGDLDAYAELLDAELASDQLGLGDELDTARAEVAAAAVDGTLERVRARSLGLRVELGVLRDTASQLAQR